jgi:sulfur relay (sulfurtransferase) complex TusBCD TusD component (DsrE family)
VSWASQTSRNKAIQRLELTGSEGVDFVICRICGDRRRVISGRHLSKHDIDRAMYMDEYELSPDELIAKAFRVIQSGRAAYEPYSKRQWITAIQKFYR